ncbi:MAG: hypothetical protein C0467_10370 [Planctomycetaceae bacterium]|nr:hypothetical protein [Planctomycetaceae bacterium]
MTRHLCWVAVLGVVTLPDWASANWPRWVARHEAGYGLFHRPVFHRHAAYPTTQSYPSYTLYAAAPAYPQYAAAPVYSEWYPAALCVCPPTQGAPLPPPRVEAIPRPAPAPSVSVTPRETTPQVRPASDNTLSPAIPASPPPKKANPPAVTQAEPSALPKFPVVDIPKNLETLPKLDVPKNPDFRPIEVPKEMPKDPVKPAVPTPAPAALEPKLPEMPAAVPSAAPALPEGLIPAPSVPELPDPKKPPLPSLTLPPESPVAPKASTSRSSPLTADRRNEGTVTIYAAQAQRGDFPGEGYKTVGFFNHTGRDVSLTIEGRAVNLPAKTYLYAKLAPTFTWGHGENSPVREAVPAGASGLDVVFRE